MLACIGYDGTAFGCVRLAFQRLDILRTRPIRNSHTFSAAEIGREAGCSEKKQKNSDRSRDKVMLLLLDRAKVAKSPAGERRPAGSNDLLSAVTAEMWVIEHDQLVRNIEGRPGIEKLTKYRSIPICC
jgi:hypothetical protein